MTGVPFRLKTLARTHPPTPTHTHTHRSVKLRHDPDASLLGICDHTLNVLLAVDVLRRVGPLGTELRVGGADVGEGLVVHNVPVKDIELVEGHSVLRGGGKASDG